VQQYVTLTASISSAGGGAPTGTVTFTTNAGLNLGSATVSNGSASISTDQLPLGPISVIAAYSGDANHQPSNGALSFSINPGVTLTVNPTTLTIHPGQSQQTRLTVTPVGNFAGVTNPVSLTCVPSGPGLTCSLSASALNKASGVVTVTLTAAPTMSAQREGDLGRSSPLSAALFLPGILGLVVLCRVRSGRRTLRPLIVAGIVFTGALLLNSCNSGSSSPPPLKPVTQTVTINAFSTQSGFFSTTYIQVTIQ
jgi:hypothetical protein